MPLRVFHSRQKQEQEGQRLARNNLCNKELTIRDCKESFGHKASKSPANKAGSQNMELSRQVPDHLWCEVCEKSFATFKSRKRHQSTITHKKAQLVAIQTQGKRSSVAQGDTNLVSEANLDRKGIKETDMNRTTAAERLKDLETRSTDRKSDVGVIKEACTKNEGKEVKQPVPDKPAKHDLEEQKEASEKHEPATAQDCHGEAAQVEGEMKSRRRYFTCTPCEKQYFYKYELNRHTKTLSHSERLKEIGKIPSGLQTKAHQCPHCDKKFQQINSLPRHIRTHHPEEIEGFTPIECKICYKVFRENFLLNRHIKIHTQDKPFQCEICFKWFDRKDVLQVHLNVHANIKKYKCEDCPKAFAALCNLKTHQNIHSQTWAFLCDKCPAGFSQKGELLMHISQHKKHQENGHICDTCGIYLGSRTAFNRHNTVKHICRKCMKTEKKCTCGKKVVVVRLKPE